MQSMKRCTCLLLLLTVARVSEAHAQRVTGDIPYATAYNYPIPPAAEES
jgi:hypothetical protein